MRGLKLFGVGAALVLLAMAAGIKKMRSLKVLAFVGLVVAIAVYLQATAQQQPPPEQCPTFLIPGGCKFAFSGDGKTNAFNLQFTVGTFSPLLDGIRILGKQKQAGTGKENVANLKKPGAIQNRASNPQVKEVDKINVSNASSIFRNDDNKFARGDFISVTVTLALHPRRIS